MASGKQTILIIGGGSAGVNTAKGLSAALDPSRFNIQLVTERPFSIWFPAMARAVVTAEGELDKRAIIPFDKLFAPGKAGEIVYGQVTSINSSSATLADGTQLRYDYLVLATGTKWVGPFDIPKDVEGRDEWFVDWRRKFAKANDIVIVGAGAAGYELAGELSHFYPGKHVTIVHSDTRVLNDAYPDKFRAHAARRLEDAGVRVILGDRVSLPQEPYTSVTTEKGVKIPADLVIPLWGGRLNTDVVKTLDPSVVTGKGAIRVTKGLCVQLRSGQTNVYAVGDIIDWKEQKMVAKTQGHVAVVVPNILASIQGKPATKEYKGGIEAVVLPLGPDKGTGYLPLLWGITLGNFFSRMIKSKGLFIDSARAVMGYA